MTALTALPQRDPTDDQARLRATLHALVDALVDLLPTPAPPAPTPLPDPQAGTPDGALLLTTTEAGARLGQDDRWMRHMIARGTYDDATRRVTLDGRVIAINASIGDARRVWMVPANWITWYAGLMD